ncbi:MAG TPA: hypothetical protein VFB22_00865 [Candidatus Baltobacteraceae bacterium]|nr:hypothetical protein [Candidatus Baltobacteraceae bacterium]
MFASLAASSLAACSGSHGSLPAPVPIQTPVSQAKYTGPMVAATFTITIPPPKKKGTSNATGTRRPQYVSPSTKKLVFTLNSTTNGLTAAQISSINSTDLGAKAVTVPSSTCVASGANYVCTLSILLPPGSDNLTIAAEDASSNVLSEQTQTFPVTAGKANNLSVTLDANVSTMAVNVSSGYCAGTFSVAANQTVAGAGTTAVTFDVAVTDPDSNTIPGSVPGEPVIEVSVNGSANITTAGTSNGVAVAVNQSQQSFTLAATNGTVTTTEPITLTVTHNSGDGLSFTETLAFTFQSGPTPGSGFLALVEQTNSTPGHAAGQVDLLTLNGWPDPTGFTNYSPSTLTPTASGDVDNPQDMVFDTNGDLMIANGGAGSPDFGNFACIPAGAITAGASADATVITSTHLDDPASIAFGTDSSVGIADDAPPNGSADLLDEFVLSGTYTEASSTRQVTDNNYSGLGALGVITLPTSAQNPAGSYAVSIGNGSNPPTSNPLNQNPGGEPPSTSEVVFKHPDGSTATLNDSDNTLGLADIAYDSSTGYLITASGIANNNNNTATGTTAYLDAWRTTSGSQTSPVWSYVMVSAGTTPASSWFSPNHVAVSSTGYIAVSGEDQNGAMFVQVYNDGASAPTLQGAPIPFDGTTTSGGSTYAFDPGAGANGYEVFVNSLKFLTSHKLLIGVQTYDGTYQGFYIYDVSNLNVPGSAGYPTGTGQPCSPCYDQFGNAFGAGPTFVAFHKTTNHPLASAFKP